MRWIFLTMAMLVLACDSREPVAVQPPITEPGPDSIDCPAPVDDIHGYRSPTYASIQQTVSHDGRFIAYMSSETAMRVLDLHTMQDRRIDIEAMMPDSIRFIGVGNIVWCPYDNTRLAMSAVTLTDTIGDRKRFVYGQHLVLLSLINHNVTFITPPLFDKAGAASIRLHMWLKKSSIHDDTLLIAYRNPSKDGDWFPKVLYRFKNQDILPDRFPPAVQEEQLVESPDASKFMGVVPSPSSEDEVYLNGVNFHLSTNVIKKASWSPNGKMVALSVMPKQGGPKGTFEQIWILDAEKILRERPDTPSVNIIDLQTRFCSYSFLGCHAEFITDSTLAVSMHPDGGSSPLWEISTTGRKIRQLTFLP